MARKSICTDADMSFLQKIVVMSKNVIFRGCHVQSRDHLSQAPAYLEAYEYPRMVILLDLVLPNLSGLQYPLGP